MRKKHSFEVTPTYSTGELQYVVRFTDYPNVIGAGDTVEEAIEEAEGNLEFYFEYLEDKKKQSLDFIFKQFPEIGTFDNLINIIKTGLYYASLESMCDLLCPGVEDEEYEDEE